MKKTAAALMLCAGLGGCVSPSGSTQTASNNKPQMGASRGKTVPGVVGPTGEPIMMTQAAEKAMSKDAKVVQASGTMPTGMVDSSVMPAAGFSRIIGHAGTTGGNNGCDTGCSNGSVHMPGGFMSRGGHSGGMSGGYNAPSYGGIYPVPGMGPAGAVAAVGAIGAFGGPPGGGAMYQNQRTSIKFVNPQGMKVTWLGPVGYIEPGLTTPASYNFAEGSVYRLRIGGIPTRPGKVYYPSLEVTNATPKTIEFLSHNTVPVGFTDEDFAQVTAGNLVTKVIYLPDPTFADLAVGGAEELVSTKLEPGADPIAEANRRGTILAVIRLGNIDLENPYSPAMDAMPAGAPRMMPGAPMMAPPGGNMPAPGGKVSSNAGKASISSNPVKQTSMK